MQQQPAKTVLCFAPVLRLSNQPEAGSKATLCRVARPCLAHPALILETGACGTVPPASGRSGGVPEKVGLCNTRQRLPTLSCLESRNAGGACAHGIAVPRLAVQQA